MRASEFTNTKLVIFDIDDTLVNTDTKVGVVRDGRVDKRLNSHDFTHYKLQPGESFDFGAFRDAQEFFQNARPIAPMISQLKRDIATGNKVIMVTARADFDDRDVFLNTFRKYGVEIEKVQVYLAGNIELKVPTEEKKKMIIRNVMGKDHYDKVIMYDDAEPNLQAFMSLASEYPWSKFYAWHVDPKGNATEYHRSSFKENADPKKDPEAYRAHLLKTLPYMMGFLKKVVKDWRPTEEQMLDAIDIAYEVMKETGDVKVAGKAFQDHLQKLHKMSQDVAEGIEEQFEFNLDLDRQTLYVNDQHGLPAGRIEFSNPNEKNPNTINIDMIIVQPKYQRQGLASAMYGYLKKQGYKILRPTELTPDGEKFFGKINQRGVTESTNGKTPSGYTWSFEHGGEIPWKSGAEANTFIRVKDGKGKTVLGVWADVYKDTVEVQYSEVFDKKLRGKGIYTDFLKGLSKHYNIISDQDHNNAAREIYKKLGATYDYRTEKHTLSRPNQDVTEDTVDEMALAKYQTFGDFNKPGPFRGADKKLVPHPKNIEKATKFFEQTPYDFRLFFSNVPGTGKYSEYGAMPPEMITQIFGKEQAEEIINGSEDAITVVYVGNKGDSKVMLTPWMMAHRFGHAIRAEAAYENKNWKAWAEAEKYFFQTVNSVLEEHYGKAYRGANTYNTPIKWDMTPEYNALFNALGTQRSSRSGQIKRPYEFFYEIFAQYLGTGKITFNPLPTNLGYGRQAWGKPTKYLNIKPEYRDEGERKQEAERLAYTMELLFNDVLSASVGKIFVM